MSLFDDDYTVIGFGLLILLLVLVFCGFLLKRRPSKFTIQKRSKMLNVSQKKLFETLINDLGHDFYIFAGVDMRRIVELSSKAKRRHRKEALSAMSQGYFDFVLVSPATMSVYAVIQLQDFSTIKTNLGKVPENAITRICESANLKLFYFDAHEDYSRRDLTKLITGKPGKAYRDQVDHQSVLELQSRSYTVDGDIRTCPKCRSELVTKVATKGRSLGEKFHLCRKYPYCDFRIAAKDNRAVANLDREERKRKSTADVYYNKW